MQAADLWDLGSPRQTTYRAALVLSIGRDQEVDDQNQPEKLNAPIYNYLEFETKFATNRRPTRVVFIPVAACVRSGPTPRERVFFVRTTGLKGILQSIRGGFRALHTLASAQREDARARNLCAVQFQLEDGCANNLHDRGHWQNTRNPTRDRIL
jgi:hypothetical protein